MPKELLTQELHHVVGGSKKRTPPDRFIIHLAPHGQTEIQKSRKVEIKFFWFNFFHGLRKD